MVTMIQYVMDEYIILSVSFILTYFIKVCQVGRYRLRERECVMEMIMNTFNLITNDWMLFLFMLMSKLRYLIGW